MKAGKASRITTSTILTAIAVVLASSTMITTPVMAQVMPVYTQLVKATATQNPGASFLSVTAGGNIPRFQDIYIRSVLVFGYAWVDGNTGHAIVAVIHPSFRDSNQNPDAWHTHTVTLSQGTASSNFCIQQLGTSQGGISIIGNVLRVNIAIAQTGSITPTAAASFAVQQDSGCTATGLGVKVLSGPVSISQ